MTTAAVSDGVIYVNSNHGFFQDSVTFALDAADGSVLWEQRLDAPVFGALALSNGILYHGAVDGTVYAFDAFDGAILWNGDAGGRIGGGLSIADGTVYVGTGFGDPPALRPVENGSLIAYSTP